MSIRIGSDPEFFLRTFGGDFLPAEYVLPPGGTEGPNVPFFDGFQGEITTAPVESMNEVRKHLCDAVGAICRLREKRVVPFVAPAIDVPPRILNVTPPSAFEFGCSPSINAYSNEKRDAELIQALHRNHEGIMMAGGHIHLGMPGGANRKNPSDKMVPFAAVFDFAYPDIIRMFETIGVTLLTVAEVSNGELELYRNRRKFYGLAGEYRHTRYGIEMRSPSCVWLMAPELSEMMYAAAAISYYSVFTGSHEEVIEQIPLEELIAAINASDIPGCLGIHAKATDILQASFESKHDIKVSSDIKYPNIWDYIREIHDMVISRINLYEHFGTMEKAWQVA